jgi:hypothetical protein
VFGQAFFTDAINLKINNIKIMEDVEFIFAMNGEILINFALM